MSKCISQVKFWSFSVAGEGIYEGSICMDNIKVITIKNKNSYTVGHWMYVINVLMCLSIYFMLKFETETNTFTQ